MKGSYIYLINKGIFFNVTAGKGKVGDNRATESRFPTLQASVFQPRCEVDSLSQQEQDRQPQGKTE